MNRKIFYIETKIIDPQPMVPTNVKKIIINTSVVHLVIKWSAIFNEHVL